MFRLHILSTHKMVLTIASDTINEYEVCITALALHLHLYGSVDPFRLSKFHNYIFTLMFIAIDYTWAIIFFFCLLPIRWSKFVIVKSYHCISCLPDLLKWFWILPFVIKYMTYCSEHCDSTDFIHRTLMPSFMSIIKKEMGYILEHRAIRP